MAATKATKEPGKIRKAITSQVQKYKDHKERLEKALKEQQRESQKQLDAIREAAEGTLVERDATAKENARHKSRIDNLTRKLAEHSVRSQELGTVDRQMFVDGSGGAAGSAIYQAVMLLVQWKLIPSGASTSTIKQFIASHQAWFYDLVLGLMGLVGYGFALRRPTLDKDGNPYLPTRGRAVTTETAKVVAEVGLNQAVRVALRGWIFKQ